MSDPDEITGVKNSRQHIGATAKLIASMFRNQRLLLKSELLKAVGEGQKAIIEWVFRTSPAEFGLKTPFCGIEEPTDKSVFEVIERQLPNLKGEMVPDIQYVPKPAYGAFLSMKSEMEHEINGHLDIGSAYRSPAFQVLVICYWLASNDFDIRETLAYVGLPGYSEHGSIRNCAIDFQIGEEIWLPSERAEKLAKRNEFRWLVKNAERFGFKLSYPKGNAYGVNFEPWHWRYLPR